MKISIKSIISINFSLFLIFLFSCNSQNSHSIESDEVIEQMIVGEWENIETEKEFEDGEVFENIAILRIKFNIDDHTFKANFQLKMTNPEEMNYFKGEFSGTWRANKKYLETITDDKTIEFQFNEDIVALMSKKEFEEEKNELYEGFKGIEKVGIENLNSNTLIVNYQGEETIYHRVDKSNEKTVQLKGENDNTSTKQSGKLKYMEISDGNLKRITLDPQAGNTYEASNLYDGNDNTAWVIGEKKCRKFMEETEYHDEPCISLRFDGKKLTHAIIKNGYNKNSQSYYSNSRIKKISVLAYQDDSRLSVGRLFEGKLVDTPFEQTIQFKDINQPYDYISIIVEDEYPGEKFRDICLNEIELYGY